MSKFAQVSNSIFFLCDVQHKFVPLIYNMPALTNSLTFLLKSMQNLKIPIISTEHYSKRLGKTLPSLAQILASHPETHSIFEKRVFSMHIPELQKELSKFPNRK